MGRFISDKKSDHSSNSDEEENVRHDRFKSERFKEESSKSASYRDKRQSYRNADSLEEESSKSASYRHKEQSYRNFNSHSSRRRRERSPPSRYSSRGSKFSSQDEIRKSSHDKRDRRHHSKSNNSRPSKDERITSETQEHKNVSNEPTKRTLSSMLKKFDENLESKRKNLEREDKIGPIVSACLKESQEKDEVLAKGNLSTEEPIIGPALPPCLKSTPTSCDDEAERSENLIPKVSEINVKYSEGPELPPHLKQSLDNLKNETILTGSDEDDSDQKINPTTSVLDQNDVLLPAKTDRGSYGPVLPVVVESDSYGPALPPNFKKDNIQGPTLPEGVTAEQLETLAQEESEDEDMVGPLPEGQMNMTQLHLDMRASDIKRKLEEEKYGTSTDVKKREEWMLELPPGKASNLGLGPRSFRTREAPDMSDRSSWTDTPADKLRKMEQSLSGEPEPSDPEELKRTAFIKERDSAMDKMAQLSRDKDRPKSLLEMHQKKIKKKKKKEEKEGKKKERRPFDRNIDLQVNRFDEAQKKAIFKKAQFLDSRFSTGESKYL